MKRTKENALGYIRATAMIKSFKELFTLIVVSNSELDSDVVLSARELEECFELLVNERKSMICHESKSMSSVPLTFQRLPNKETIALDKETVGAKLKITMQNGKKVNEPKTAQPKLSMASDRSRDDDEARTVNCGLL